LQPPRRDLEIWAGGQTGVDRAALDTALELRLPHGGWIPLGRRAEDGTVPSRYTGLREADSADYAVRTYLNVRDTSATLILRWGPAAGGTRHTVEVAGRLGRPVLEIDLAVTTPDAAAAQVVAWLDRLPPDLRLNVAGPRASEAPEAYSAVRAVLSRALSQGQNWNKKKSREES
jgi:Circularly permutated YpsA SLOG family